MPPTTRVRSKKHRLTSSTLRRHDRGAWRDEVRRLLPTFEDEGMPSAIPAPEVTKVALRLRYLVESVVPCELEEDQITKAHSRVITTAVVKAAAEAGRVGEGEDYSACVVRSPSYAWALGLHKIRLALIRKMADLCIAR